MNYTLSLSTLVGALVASIFPITSVAQTQSRIVVTDVKPDMLYDWLSLQQTEVLPALKKAGVRTQTVYSSGVFGRAGEYVTVQPLPSMADFDGPNPLVRVLGQPGAARLNERTRRYVNSQLAYMSTRWDDASNITDTPPNVLVAARYRLAPGKAAEVREIIRSEVLPVYKKGKVYLAVNARGPGANPNDITMITGFSKYADWDGGPYLTRALGAAEAAKINARMNSMRTLIEVVVRQRVADLSF